MEEVMNEELTVTWQLYDQTKADADRRLALLKRWNNMRMNRGDPCPDCFLLPTPRDDHHAPDCELAKEFADEDSEGGISDD